MSENNNESIEVQIFSSLPLRKDFIKENLGSIDYFLFERPYKEMPTAIEVEISSAEREIIPSISEVLEFFDARQILARAAELGQYQIDMYVQDLTNGKFSLDGLDEKAKREIHEKGLKAQTIYFDKTLDKNVDVVGKFWEIMSKYAVDEKELPSGIEIKNFYAAFSATEPERNPMRETIEQIYRSKFPNTKSKDLVEIMNNDFIFINKYNRYFNSVFSSFFNLSINDLFTNIVTNYFAQFAMLMNVFSKRED